MPEDTLGGADISTLQVILPQRAIVIPAYNEADALPLLIAELSLHLTERDVIIVVDDSTLTTARDTEVRCWAMAGDAAHNLIFDHSYQRGGRGGAVRRGLKLALSIWPNVHWFVECDADGSHRAVDVIRVLNSDLSSDLLVGSRYLPDSRIIGWSASRRIQSRALNILIPRILKLHIHDVTNGLRRYSRRAVEQLLRYDPVSSTFIYLTEQALILHRSGFSIDEVPIIFEERRAGESSVTWRELQASFRGLRRIIKMRSLFQSRSAS